MPVSCPWTIMNMPEHFQEPHWSWKMLNIFLFEEPRITPETGLASLPFRLPFTHSLHTFALLSLGCGLTGASQRTHTWQSFEMSSELGCNHNWIKLQTYAITAKMRSQSSCISCFNQARFAHLQPPGVPCRPNPGCNVWGMPPPHLSCHPKNDVDKGQVLCFLPNCSLVFLLGVL